MKIDFYYWNYQCPYNAHILEILKDFQKEKDYIINLIDVSKDEEKAKEVKMFSPTLLIFNDNIRWNGPISSETIKKIEKGIVPEVRPYKVSLGEKLLRGNIELLTEENVDKVFTCCAPNDNIKSCIKKGSFIKNIREKYKLKSTGVLHFIEGKCVGGAEFVPSLEVPYDIYKNRDTAFLTCSYLSDEKYDYRSYPLMILEQELKKMNFNKLEVIASEDVVFPNGTVSYFMGRGFKDLGEIYYEERDLARMHILMKDL